MAILEVNNLKKTYTSRFGSVQVHALTDVSFSVEEGEYVAIMGESGSRQDHSSEHAGGAGSAHRRRGAA